MLITITSLVFIGEVFLAYKMYLSRWKARIRLIRAEKLKLAYLLDALHFASVICSLVLLVSSVLFTLDLGKAIEPGVAGSVIEACGSIIIAICVAPPVIVWVMIELFGALFFNKEFAGGGLK